jgi:hypothetical protein
MVDAVAPRVGTKFLGAGGNRVDHISLARGQRPHFSSPEQNGGGSELSLFITYLYFTSTVLYGTFLVPNAAPPPRPRPACEERRGKSSSVDVPGDDNTPFFLSLEIEAKYSTAPFIAIVLYSSTVVPGIISTVQ